MSKLAKRLGAAKAASTLLVLFVPSVDRNENKIDQEYWLAQSLEFLGTYFGGATAYPKGHGVWRDDARGGTLVFDQPLVIQCYTSESVLMRHADQLKDFLVRMGTETHQGAVGFVVDRDYLEISFPLEE